jgi:hypothetical protein
VVAVVVMPMAVMAMVAVVMVMAMVAVVMVMAVVTVVMVMAVMVVMAVVSVMTVMAVMATAVHHVPTAAMATAMTATMTAGVRGGGGESRRGDSDRCSNGEDCSALEHFSGSLVPRPGSSPDP